MKRQQKPRKLQLAAESVRVLTAEQLRAAPGGEREPTSRAVEECSGLTQCSGAYCLQTNGCL